MLKRSIAALVCLSLLCLGTMPLAAQLTEIKFIGTAQSFHQLIGGSWWVVRVEQVVFGPQPCTTELRVITWTSGTPPLIWGYVDPEIKPNDRVQVYGRYLTDPHKESGCYVTLEWSGLYGSSLYFIRLPLEVLAADIIIEPVAPTTADEIKATVTVTFSKEFSNECFASAQLSDLKRQGGRFSVTAGEIRPEVACILVYRPTRVGQRTYILGRLAAGTYTFELYDFSRLVQSRSFTVAQAEQTIERALDLNGNNIIDDPEIIQAIHWWIRQEPVPGTNGQRISDATMIELLDLWIHGYSLE